MDIDPAVARLQRGYDKLGEADLLPSPGIIFTVAGLLEKVKIKRPGYTEKMLEDVLRQADEDELVLLNPDGRCVRLVMVARDAQELVPATRTVETVVPENLPPRFRQSDASEELEAEVERLRRELSAERQRADTSEQRVQELEKELHHAQEKLEAVTICFEEGLNIVRDKTT